MDIFYWSPFISKVATVSSVIRSAETLVKYSKKKINVSLIDAIGEWDEYKNMDLKKINHCMKGKLFVDLRNIFDPQEMEEIGFEYHSVGR